SRRRHTISKRDWSSDVCSSDLLTNFTLSLCTSIFLDRDGVINEVLSERVKFVNRPEDFYLLPGAGEAIHLLNQSQYPVFVVTNRAEERRIGKGGKTIGRRGLHH